MPYLNKDIDLVGYEGLAKQFRDLADISDSKEMEGKLIIRARELRTFIRKRVPRGHKGSGSVEPYSNTFKYPTGNLVKAIEARKFKRKVLGSPAVYVRVNRKKAPHYHLVEFGTVNFRFPKKKRKLHFYYEGEEVYANMVAPMPPNPFFRPTVDERRYQIETNIKMDTEKMILKIASDRHYRSIRDKL